MPTIRINSQNFDGIPCDIYFTGCTGNTDVITGVTLPYDYTTTDYLGYYSIYFPLYDKYCELNISCPSPTPTPTMTVTPTNTATPTPTVTPTMTPTPSGSSFDSDAAAYLADVVASGGTTDATISAATDTLFTSLKSNGLYSKMLVMYPFIGGVAASHRLNAKRTSSQYDGTFSGGFTHDVSGSTGNGTNGYLNSNFPISAYTANNYSLGYYQYTDNNTGDYIMTGIRRAVGTVQTPVLQLSTKIGSDYFMRLGDDTAFTTANGGNRNGFICGSRTGSTKADLYRNGTNVGTLTDNPGASIANEAWQTLVFNTNNDPSIGSSTPNPLAGYYADEGLNFYFISTGLLSSEISTLSTIINTFQTSLGRNTY